MTVQFFEKPADFRRWLSKNHKKAEELWVGFYKTSSKRPSITWPESVDQALCFGWIDGLRKNLDESSYQIRFTPRKPTSVWSAINIAKVEALTEAGLMKPAGLEAFAKRQEKKSRIYSHERTTEPELAPAELKRLKADKTGWKFFSAQAGSYRRAALHWVITAKKPETREKRLVKLIEHCAREKTLPQFTRRPAKASR